MRAEVNARFSRALNPNLLHLACGLSQAGRVGNQDRESTSIERDLQHVARRARYMGDNRIFALGCLIRQNVRLWDRYPKERGGSVVPRMFRRLLLPTFGGPKIARRIPVSYDLTPSIGLYAIT
jgi:hypothetical protein